MSKLLQMSVIFAMVAIPVIAAREKNPQKGLRKVITHMVYFNLFYLFFLLFGFGRL